MSVTTDDDWMSGASSYERSAPTPWWPVGAALGATAVSLYLAFFGGTLGLNALGYVMGGVVGPAFVAVDRAVENARRSSATHSANVNRARVVLIATVLTLAATLLNAWLIATELAKR